MKNLYFLRSMFLSALAAMAITACSDSDEGGNDGEGPGGGETPAPTSSLTVNEKAEAQTFTYDMKATKEALAIDASGDWTLTCDDEEAPTWCTPDITEGKSGKSTLTFDVKVPLLPTKANYTLALKDDAEVNVKIVVEQMPKGVWIGLSKESLEFPATGGTEEVTVYAYNLPANCVIYANSDPYKPVGQQFIMEPNWQTAEFTSGQTISITTKAYNALYPEAAYEFIVSIDYNETLASVILPMTQLAE